MENNKTFTTEGNESKGGDTGMPEASQSLIPGSIALDEGKAFATGGNESTEGEAGMPDASQSSVQGSIALDEERSAVAASHTFLPPVPERTLKEKLVERERQKRIETERARLKRQFALSNDMMNEDEDEGREPFPGDIHNHIKDGSLVGTVGEGSSVAVVREDEDEKSEKLGYAMERFLSEQGQEKRGVETPNSNGKDEGMLKKEETGGVVMERFLSEPVVVVPPSDVADDEPPTTSDNAVGQMEQMENEQKPEMPVDVVTEPPEATATVTFETTITPTPENLPKLQPRDGGDSELGATAGSISYVSSVGDEDDITGMNSIDVDTHSNVAELDDLERFTEPDSPSLEPSLSNTSTEQQGPRVLRLTEREIQEMAAIEEASIGNAPPSEREDTLSEVGDLVGSFMGGRDFLHPEIGGFSVQTHTTASVSNTSAGGNQSGGGQSHEVSAGQRSIESVSVSSHLALSPGGSEAGVSVTVNPPSVVVPNDTEEEPNPSSIIPPDEVLAPTTSPTDLPTIPTFDENMGIGVDGGGPLSIADAEASALQNEGIVNRRVRPGIRSSPIRQLDEIRNSTDTRNEVRRTHSMPEILHATVDGFDFDKHDYIPTTPRSNANDSYRDLPGSDTNNSHSMNATRWSNDDNSMNVSPILIPGLRALGEIEKPHDQSIQSLLVENRDGKIHDARLDDNNSAINRLFPERFQALITTFLMEIPVLLIISRGSEALYLLIGQKRYQLLMGFLPISSAIASTCVQQARIFAAGSIHLYQSTKESPKDIILKELKAGTLLGIGMGIILGISAFAMSGFDLPFGFSIFLSQFFSIFFAGLTGSFIALLLHRNDSSTWNTFFHTVIPDLVGSLTMILLSYHFLVFSGTSEADQSCSAGVT